MTLSTPASATDWASARRLVEQYARSLGFDLSFQNFAHEIGNLPAEYGPPAGAFVLAAVDGEAVGCGGVRRFDEDCCEMKRLYVAPSHRGAGIGRAIVQALVARARALGYRAMLLDTLESMSAAQALYVSAGFRPAAAYRHNPLAGAMFWRLELMPHTLDHTLALLERTPRTLDVLLRDLPDAWTATNEGPGTWSAYDVVGHLTHGERAEWMARVRMIVDAGESKTFEKFDRLAQERESQGKSLGELLDEFARARAGNLQQVRAMNLTPADLDRRGRHPSFGPVTLGQLLSTWAAHDLTHLHQLSRVMAYQYRDAVGPWRTYLGVLHCTGHGS